MRKLRITTKFDTIDLILSGIKTQHIEAIIPGNPYYEVGEQIELYGKNVDKGHVIRIKSVAIKTLYEITLEDAIKNGVIQLNIHTYVTPEGREFTSYIKAFKHMWDVIHGKNDFDNNYSVRVYEFELIK